jgi:hypothetical protein
MRVCSPFNQDIPFKEKPIELPPQLCGKRISKETFIIGKTYGTLDPIHARLKNSDLNTYQLLTKILFSKFIEYP